MGTVDQFILRRTTYTYDAYNRLTAFDVVDAAAGRLIKQDWAYDALGRKGHTANGWYPRDNGSGTYQHIEYVNDNVRVRVLAITNDVGATATAKSIIGDTAAGTLNPNDDDFNTTRTVLSMWVKGDGTNYFNIAVLATTNLATRLLYLNTVDGSDLKYAPPSTSYEFRIGAGYRAARWQYLEVDLAARVDGLEPGETISRIDAIIPIVGRYLAIDDIKFGDGRLSRSWAQVPGAALGGYLGAQTGAAGAVGLSAWDKYYYHFSDLGTVMATTDADGYTLGVYQPDFWGNYREVYGVRPDTMGLTGKFYDEDLELNYSNARWYDPERGIFMSLTPYRSDIERQYTACHNNAVNYIDTDGQLPWLPGWPGPWPLPTNPISGLLTQPIHRFLPRSSPWHFPTAFKSPLYEGGMMPSRIALLRIGTVAAAGAGIGYFGVTMPSQTAVINARTDNMIEDFKDQDFNCCLSKCRKDPNLDNGVETGSDFRECMEGCMRRNGW